jgi:hypothetical protein
MTYTIYKSTRKNKKYDVYDNGKYLLSFGDARYQQYYDKLGAYKHLNHYDENRRRLYYLRHGYTDNIKSAKYWSNRYLW